MGVNVSRRNTISSTAARVNLGIAAAAGVFATLAGAQPTGAQPVDAVLCFALAAFTTWLGASASWWALAAGAGLVAAASFQSPVALTIIGAVALLDALWVGVRRSSQAIERAAIAGATVSIALRLTMTDFFLESALVAFIAIAPIIVLGWLRRPRYVRKRVVWGAVAFATVMLFGVAGITVGGAQAKSSATDGYQLLLEGLNQLDDADMPAASATLAEAAAAFRDAGEDLDSPLTQSARLVPGLAQNRTAARRLMNDAAEAAAAASATLAVIDLNQLAIVNGRIDVDALKLLTGPLTDLAATVSELADTLHEVDSPWLIGPLDSRLATASKRVDKVDRQADQLAATSSVAPAMLGADGPRRYLLAFTNPAESRGVSGLMGNWNEVTITDGAIDVTATGRTARLVDGLRENGVQLDMPDEYFTRYAADGAGAPGTDADPKFWSNVTLPPDMPSVGAAMSQMYQAATGTPVDGVFVIDPAGIAALLDATDNSVFVDGLAQALDGDTIEQFLLLDQYEFAENEREDLLAAVTEQTVQAILRSSLPKPQQLIAGLGPAALGGHVSIWAERADEQAFLRLIGVDNALPGFTGPYGSADGLAVVSNNENGNKIDSFLRRTVEYTAEYDQASGEVNSELILTLRNDAPTSGYPDYVIGNLVDEPIGTNSMLVNIYSRLLATSFTIDGETFTMDREAELGWNVYTDFFVVPPGESQTITITFNGIVGHGGYGLIYRPQALPNADKLALTARSGGTTLFRFIGELDRRSVLTPVGVRAWRE